MTLRFRFTHYRSSRLRAMLQVAERGHLKVRFQPMQPGDWYVVEYDLSQREHVQAALTLAELLYRHPCAEAYGNGQRIRLTIIDSILRCYEKSFGSANWRAHCWKPYPGRFFEDEATRGPIRHTVFIGMKGPCGDIPTRTEYDDGYQRPPVHPVWYFPCRYASCSQEVGDLSLLHPASLREQVESILTDREVHWCPRLRHLDEWDFNQWGPLTDGSETQ